LLDFFLGVAALDFAGGFAEPAAAFARAEAAAFLFRFEEDRATLLAILVVLPAVFLVDFALVGISSL